MNKVFKIVWSKTKGCYVVASEFAKSHHRSTYRIRYGTADPENDGEEQDAYHSVTGRR